MPYLERTSCVDVNKIIIPGGRNILAECIEDFGDNTHSFHHMNMDDVNSQLIDMVRLLLEKGADITNCDHAGNTILHHAALFGHD